MKLLLLALLVASGIGCAARTGYRDATGKYHDHAATAAMATHCYCGASCDRKTACCGPEHCVCNPN